MVTQANGYMPDPRPWWKKMVNKLFPVQHCVDTGELPDGYTDQIFSCVVVQVDIYDRLRLLVTGRCRVQINTLTQFKPGDVKSNSVFAVLPPFE